MTAQARDAEDTAAPIVGPWLQLDAAFVVRVQVNDIGGTRTYIYRSLVAAERAVARATKRGRESHVTLCTLLPVGVT